MIVASDFGDVEGVGVPWVWGFQGYPLGMDWWGKGRWDHRGSAIVVVLDGDDTTRDAPGLLC